MSSILARISCFHLQLLPTPVTQPSFFCWYRISRAKTQMPRGKKKSSHYINTDLFIRIFYVNLSDLSSSIVFSCWKTTLDLIEPLLHSQEIKFVRIDGTFSTSERSAMMAKFKTDPIVKVILMTTGTGAVG
jgi:SNF2 family DNA or RNA helicase